MAYADGSGNYSVEAVLFPSPFDAIPKSVEFLGPSNS
jgi:hypothetical protein